MNDDLLSNRQRKAIPTQYEATIPAVIADVEVSPSGPASAEAEATAAAIVRLDGHATETVGASEVGTVQAILLRSESAASSQIEHLRVGAKQFGSGQIGGQRIGERPPGRCQRRGHVGLRHPVRPP